ncbi:hypothetical protein FGG08_001118 [Glutinoglossum americanum]|uniref:Uncharacterized protein n=1 Tax=Glutinoglossum americanum TaxID=1670608 RepID=A0A9P8L332_9PEZI|nr:hypothetical protein FGG08_001118 [Glutinoglossum americanum]
MDRRLLKLRRRGSQQLPGQKLVNLDPHRTNSDPTQARGVTDDHIEDAAQAIVYDPSAQRLYLAPKSKFNGPSPPPFTPVPIPRWSSSVDVYVNIGKTDIKAFVGRVNLKRLGWPITMMRLKGQIDTLYVLGRVRDGG